MKALALAFALLISFSCAPRRRERIFRVLPAQPEYRLGAPDARGTSFADVLNRFTPVAPAWVELRPQMELRIECAYYREGSTKRTLANFLGTQVARYQVRPGGTLRLLSVQSGLKQEPGNQPPVQRLISNSQGRYRYHRFFYEILLNRKAELRGAALLGARSAEELDRLAAQLLADPASVCGGDSS